MTHDLAALDQVLEAHRERPGGLLPALHDVQASFGCVPKEAVPRIAAAFNLSRAEVHGVVTYYHHFRQSPPGRHVIRLCQAEACQAMGAQALLDHARSALGVEPGQTTADGTVTLEVAYCLGLCASSPALLLDDDEAACAHGRVTPAAFDALVASLRTVGAASAPAAGTVEGSR